MNSMGESTSRDDNVAAQGHVPFVGGIPQGLGEPETPSAATTEPPIFVDGIGPPLSQIEQDYREILIEAEAGYVYGLPHPTCARDVLALIAEVRRLRAT